MNMIPEEYRGLHNTPKVQCFDCQLTFLARAWKGKCPFCQCIVPIKKLEPDEFYCEAPWHRAWTPKHHESKERPGRCLRCSGGV